MKYITALALVLLSAITTSARKLDLRDADYYLTHLTSEEIEEEPKISAKDTTRGFITSGGVCKVETMEVSTCFDEISTCTDISCFSADVSDAGAMKSCCPACSDVIDLFSTCVLKAENINLGGNGISYVSGDDNNNGETVQVDVDNLEGDIENISNQIIENISGVDGVCAVERIEVSTCFNNIATCADLSCSSTDVSDANAMKLCCPACSDVIELFSTCVLKAENINLGGNGISDVLGGNNNNNGETVQVGEISEPFNEEFCNDENQVENLAEDLVGKGIFVDGMQPECAKSANVLSICHQCNEDCLETNVFPICMGAQKFYDNHGCDACKEKETVHLNCLCSQGDFVDQELCKDENKFESYVEDLVYNRPLVGGEIHECKKDGFAVHVCYECNIDQCTHCLLEQVQEEPGEPDCQRVKGIFENCSCNNCKERETALLNCFCPESLNDDTGPSMGPSMNPSNMPSESPSLRRSQHPTVEPSMKPSITPTTSSSNAVSLGPFDQELCKSGSNLVSSMEAFVRTATLVDGETDQECVKESTALSFCLLCNKDQCSDCVAKLQQQKVNATTCQESKDFFDDCGCNVCSGKETALLNCFCSGSSNNNVDPSISPSGAPSEFPSVRLSAILGNDTNQEDIDSGSSDILGFWTILAAIPLTISFVI